MTELIDSHAHIQGSEFAADRDAMIERAWEAGVTAIIVPAEDVASAEAAIALAERHQGIYVTAGFHPHEATRMDGEALRGVNALLAHPKVVAVGEIGLDFYRMHSPRENQIEAFESQLELAMRKQMPVVIHCRDAWEDMARILQSWAPAIILRQTPDEGMKRPLGVMHYFTGTLKEAERYIDLGFLISVHTSVTHPKARGLREVVARLPLESLVIETDSPYGAPQSHRSKRNEPAYVVEAARQITQLKEVSLADVATLTAANARRLFGLPAATPPLAAGATV